MLRLTDARLQGIHALDLYCGMGGLSYIGRGLDQPRWSCSLPVKIYTT